MSRMGGQLNRCDWASLDNTLYIEYHDAEWGVPLHDDRKLFELLILEGAQAGLSWITILRKRGNYRSAFDSFDPAKIARYNGTKITSLLADPGIVRNRLKVESVVANAKCFLKIKEHFGTFDKFIWDFVGGRPLVNKWKRLSEVPSKTPVSDSMSKGLAKEGFKFVGSTICYSFMQASGMVNDHLVSCFRHAQVQSPRYTIAR